MSPAEASRGGAARVRRPKRRQPSKAHEASPVVKVVPAAPAVTSPPIKNERKEEKNALAKLDICIFIAYFSTCVAQTLPVLLLPLIAAEYTTNPTPFIASLASKSILFGGVGKLVNGFLVQALGGKSTSWVYLTGTFACLAALTSSRMTIGGLAVCLGALDFFASLQWTAATTVLANHYKGGARLAQAMTVLSLSSTTGALSAKLGGAALLSGLRLSWRTVSQLGAGLALFAAIVMKFLVSEHPQSAPRQKSNSGSLAKDTVKALRSICGSRLFWIAGLSHSTSYLARTSDRVLASFFGDATNLPKSLCGFLTASVTLGFAHGLTQCKQFYKFPDLRRKMGMLKSNYIRSVLFTLSLAALSFAPLRETLPQTAVINLGIFLSGAMASTMSFAFYQLPAQIAISYGENRAVCSAFVDALGLFMSAFVWGTAGKIVGSLQHGWTVVFALLATMFAAGGVGMLSQYPLIHKHQQRYS